MCYSLLSTIIYITRMNFERFLVFGELAVSIVLLPLAAITTILYGALRSAGDVTVPMAYSIATSVVVLAPPPSSSPRPSAGASRARSGRWHWPKRSRRSCWAGGGGAVGGRNSPASSTTPTARHPTPPRGHDHPPGAGDDHRAGRPLARRGRRALGAGRRVLDDAASAPAIAARAGHAGAGGRTGAGRRTPGGSRRRREGSRPAFSGAGHHGGLSTARLSPRWAEAQSSAESGSVLGGDAPPGGWESFAGGTTGRGGLA